MFCYRNAGPCACPRPCSSLFASDSSSVTSPWRETLAGGGAGGVGGAGIRRRGLGEGAPYRRLEREPRPGGEAGWRAGAGVPRRAPAAEIEEAPPSPPRLPALNAAAAAGVRTLEREMGTTTRGSLYGSRDGMLALRLREEEAQAYGESLRTCKECGQPVPVPQRNNSKISGICSWERLARVPLVAVVHLLLSCFLLGLAVLRSKHA